MIFLKDWLIEGIDSSCHWAVNISSILANAHEIQQNITHLRLILILTLKSFTTKLILDAELFSLISTTTHRLQTKRSLFSENCQKESNYELGPIAQRPRPTVGPLNGPRFANNWQMQHVLQLRPRRPRWANEHVTNCRKQKIMVSSKWIKLNISNEGSRYVINPDVITG